MRSLCVQLFKSGLGIRRKQVRMSCSSDSDCLPYVDVKFNRSLLLTTRKRKLSSSSDVIILDDSPPPRKSSCSRSEPSVKSPGKECSNTSASTIILDDSPSTSNCNSPATRAARSSSRLSSNTASRCSAYGYLRQPSASSRTCDIQPVVSDVA